MFHNCFINESCAVLKSIKLLLFTSSVPSEFCSALANYAPSQSKFLRYTSYYEIYSNTLARPIILSRSCYNEIVLPEYYVIHKLFVLLPIVY